MKKIFGFMSILVLSFVLVGCGKSNSKGNSVTLEFMTNSASEQIDAFRKVAKEYEKQNEGVKINITGQGKDFEALIKAKMASNDLPDMWMTHGWSVDRYSEYLEKLNSREWVSKISETALPSVINDSGDLFVLPIVVDKSGVLINQKVLDENNINVDDLKNWEDFTKAFDKLKANNIIPVGMSGKDPRAMAHFLDALSTPMYITSKDSQKDKLIDGSFDWKNWDKINSLLLSMKENEYLNKDALTADGESIKQQMAEDKIGFWFTTNSEVSGIYEYNPEAKIGFIPLPTFSADDSQVLVGGERTAVGVWKDSKNKETALDFLDFMAQDENIKIIADSHGLDAAIEGVDVDLGSLSEYYEKYEDTTIEPFFDRAYLPSGMWSTLQTVGAGVLSGEITVEDGSKAMEKDYIRLRK